MSPEAPRAVVGAAVRPLRLPSLRGESSERAAASRPAVERPRAPAGLAAGEAEALREQARAEGLDLGRREGRAAAHAEWAGRLERVTRALEEATLALLASRVELAAQVERQLPRLVMALGRKVIHQELSVSQTAAQTVLRGIAERLGGCEGSVIVKLNPQMVDAFEEWRRSSEGQRPAGSGVRVEPDDTLAAGEWLLETGDGFLDGRVESQLEEAWRFLEGLPR
ncbi:MAG TPA: FliH/SctL family protein [Terriglobales bacterium]|nr:FliH/SctL family protein [Terriglobales bacterium]